MLRGDLPVTEVRQIMNAAREQRPSDAVRLVCLGNVTVEPLAEYIQAVSFCCGVNVSTLTGGYEQYMQELLDPGSSLRKFDPAFVVLALDLRQLDPDLYFNCSSRPAEALDEARRELLNRLRNAVEAVLTQTRASCILFNFPRPARFRLGIADAKHPASEFAFYARLNIDVAEAFRSNLRVQIVDVESLSGGFGKERAFDRRMFYMAKIPWHESFLPVLADEILRHVEAASGRTRKCLVLDLDNTLWGGVLGEEGIYGIRIGRTDPQAEAFYEFQMRIRGLRDRGIILAVCSKNNPEDVEELFDTRSDMPLQKADFATLEVGWGSKNLGLERIADRLGIGTDSLVYVDDSSAEIDLINQTMPEVATLLLPDDPGHYCEVLDGLHGMDKISISIDDSRKTKQYSERAQRETSRQQFTDLGSYLSSLETRISVWMARSEDVHRIHQLFSKTNQFNSTTRRYTLAEVESFVKAGDCDLVVFSARDRFGDIGTIGVSLIRKEDAEVVEIDSFVMSCRAIGRGIEAAVVNELRHRYLEDEGYSGMVATFIPTRKNAPIRGFFEDEMFEVVERLPDGVMKYRLSARAAEARAADWITVDEGLSNRG